MDDTSPLMDWPDSLLREYRHMLSVRDVARALNIEESNVRSLLTAPDARTRMPGVKIGKNWRISRDQLRTYLLVHHNKNPLTRDGARADVS
ncbi:helix-turn-helix domain-containing protein [Micromonospora sp. DT81.3]|uniref:helix-turn-helix domain-containing protein n=1 Tax=Micromonospora sp. DT81.3 TaxID=3416523 RepID=UPI003CE7828A